MVRRWSYLNIINTQPFALSPVFPTVKHDLTVKQNLYFKKNYSYVSLVTRRAWLKRRRLNNFAIHRNVLADWSSEYIFYRKYVKVMFMWGLFLNTYWAQNFLLVKNANPAILPHMEKLNGVTLIKSVSRYYALCGNNQFFYLNQFVNTSWLYLATPLVNGVIKAQSRSTFWPLYKSNTVTLVPAKTSPNYTALYVDLYALVNQLILTKLKELYRLVVMLTLFHLG